MSAEKLPQFPKHPSECALGGYLLEDMREYYEELSDAWESRCRLTLEALNNYARYGGVGVNVPSNEAAIAIDAIGPLPAPPNEPPDDWEICNQQPMSKAGQKHRGHWVGKELRCWDCPAILSVSEQVGK